MLDIPSLVNGGAAALAIILVCLVVGMALTATLPTEPAEEEPDRG